MIGSQAWTLPLSGLVEISQSSESPCPACTFTARPGSRTTQRSHPTQSPIGASSKPSLQQMVVDALRHQTAGLDQSTVPAKFEASFLPGADIPEVEELKLAGYALNPGHEKGRHKAALFEMLLGIGVRDWKHLAAQLRSGLAGATIDSVD